MPKYCYRCRECGAKREEIQSIVEGEEFIADATCQEPVGGLGPDTRECEGAYERLLGGTSFKLAGKGWFRDGYR